jgi:sec-independent protein translocase protein TatC
LAKIGIITHKTLIKYVRHAVVGVFIVAGALTPSPDIYSQVLMALPLLFLYGVSILVAYFVGKKKHG